MKTISFYLLFSLFLTTVSAQQNDAVGSLAIQLEKRSLLLFLLHFIINMHLMKIILKSDMHFLTSG